VLTIGPNVIVEPAMGYEARNVLLPAFPATKPSSPKVALSCVLGSTETGATQAIVVALDPPGPPVSDTFGVVSA
jgi:hypothetical protein